MTRRTRGEPVDENELRSLFEEIEAPPSLERWRERIADVHATTADPTPFTEEDGTDDPATPGLEIRVGPGTEIHVEPGEEAKTDADGAKIRTLPTDRELRPTRRRRSVAVAAAAAVVIGLGGVVVAGQLRSDAPPADPTMIIDGPDRTRSSSPPTSATQPPTGSQAAPNVPGTGENPAGQEQDTGDGAPRDGGGPGPGGNQVAWPPMVGDPSASNTGVPVGAVLADHHGDLRITTPGQVVSDLRVTGTVIVEAQHVTLRRVIVVAAFGSPALSQNAGDLTIEDSELSGTPSVAQRANGLTVRRSRLESGVTLIGDAQLLDNYLNTADVLIQSGAAGVLLRHNVMGRVTMNDLDAPITNVTIENSVLLQVDAPTEPGSASVHVLSNRFLGSAPSTGWKPAAPDYRWSGNTFASSGASANP